jgi:hypothetical protein
MKTRQEYEEIVSYPGKFERESAYVPYFWDLYLNGGGDNYTDENDIFVTWIDFDAADYDMWPELEGYDSIKLIEDSQGFVWHELI